MQSITSTREAGMSDEMQDRIETAFFVFQIAAVMVIGGGSLILLLLGAR